MKMHQFLNQFHLQIFSAILILSLFHLACPKETVPSEKFECPDGQVPCSDDTTQCCNKIADCLPGFLPCEYDSSICCEIECPPGYIVGGVDSTECVPLECSDGYHICLDDSSDCCPDTTSHNFNWSIYQLGYGQGELLDAAIINENDIWVVGFFHAQMTFNEDSVFNAAHWNGTDWELLQIPIPHIGVDGLIGHYHSEIKSIIAFSENDIWFSTGGGRLVNWNGNEFIDHYAPYLTINNACKEIWGTSGNNIYSIGDRNGTIIHWDGNNFTQMNVPVETRLLDIYGSPDGSVIWACGWKSFQPNVLLRFRNNDWEVAYQTEGFPVIDGMISGAMETVWTDEKDKVFVATGIGFYVCPDTTQGEGERMVRWWSPKKLRGQTQGDIFEVGIYGEVYHYNGDTWYQYTEFEQYPDRLLNVDIKENVVVIVGERYYNGIEFHPIVYLGFRY